MKRVVLIRSNPVYPDPPVEKMAITLANNNYAVCILAWDRSDNYDEINELISVQGIEVPVIRFGIKAEYGAGIKTLKQLILFQIKVYKWLKQNKESYDIIHAFDFDTGYISMLCAKKIKKKIVYHILDFYVDSHNIRNGVLNKFIKKLEFKVINYSNITVICTEKRNEQILGSYPKKLIVIHNTPLNNFDIDKHFELRGDRSKCRIAYVGILSDSRYIIEIAEFVSKHKNFEFHVGGFGYLEQEIKGYAEQYDNIFFYGKLQYNQTLALESACDIMTAIYDPQVPNHRYAAPNKFYESMMLGKPVIMVKNTGFDDVFASNKIGCLIEYSVEGLESALLYLSNHRNEWKEIGIVEKQLYNEKYSWEVMKKRILSVYAEL